MKLVKTGGMYSKNSRGQIYVLISTEPSDGFQLDLCDYVFIDGHRFVRETDADSADRKNYEPGGKFEHLAGNKEH